MDTFQSDAWTQSCSAASEQLHTSWCQEILSKFTIDMLEPLWFVWVGNQKNIDQGDLFWEERALTVKKETVPRSFKAVSLWPNHFPTFVTGISNITFPVISAEIGDFEESQCRSHLLNNNYIPDQMPLIDKIMEFHSKHMWVNAGHKLERWL